MNKLRVGVIGLGKMGLLHAGIFNQLASSTVTAATESNKLVGRLLRDYVPRISVYNDYDRMFERENLDVAAIATPVFLHKPVVESALENGCHVFVEKPLALNGGECRSLMDKKITSKTLVGYNRRFLETFKLAKRIINESLLGELNLVQSQMFVTQVLRREQGWRYDRSKSGGGVIIDLGAHVLDILHYLIGPISRVQGMGKSIHSDDVDDYVSANLEFADGLVGSLQLTWSIRHYRLPEMKLAMQFEKGELTVTEKYIEIYSEVDCSVIKRGWNTYYLQDLTKGVPVNLGGPEYTAQDAHLLDCILNDEKTLCDFQEAAKTNFVADALYNSLRTTSTEDVHYEV